MYALLVFHVLETIVRRRIRAYPLLGQLAGALVLGVAEEFDNAALVGGEARWEGALLAKVLMFSLMGEVGLGLGAAMELPKPLARHPRANCAYPEPSSKPNAQNIQTKHRGAIELTQQPP